MSVHKNKPNEIIISALTAVLLLLAVYAVKHIYPFGGNSVSYYDMNQSFIPLYTRTWDILHGKADPLFNWYTAAGTSHTSTLCSFVLSPFNLFFLLVKRENIYESMSFFLMLKIGFAAASMSFFAKDRQGLCGVENVAVSVLYALGGYVLQYYTNIYFLDTVVFFPLVMSGFYAMAKKDSGLFYTLMLALTLVSGPYLGLISVIYLLFYSAGYMYIILEKGQRKHFAAKLGLYTLAAFAIAAVFLVPTVLSWAASNRFGSENTGYLDILKTLDCSEQGSKSFMLFGCELGAAAMITGLLKCVKGGKKPTKAQALCIYAFVLLLLPILFESVNIMWHFGSYHSFPARYAFILAFVSAQMYAEFSKELSVKATKRLAVYGAVLVLISGIAVLAKISVRLMDFGIYVQSAFSGFWLYFVLMTLAFSLVLAFVKKRTALCFITPSLAVLCLIAGIGLIAPKGNDEYNNIQSTATMPRFIGESLLLNGHDDISRDNLSRIKNIYPDLSPNFALVAGIPSLSSWTNCESADYFDHAARLGYSVGYCKILNEGGTAFSDALLNVKQVVSRTPVNESLYKKSGAAGDFVIYDCKNTLPFGLITDSGFADTNTFLSGIALQNDIYKKLSGKNDDIIEDCAKYYEKCEKADGNVFYTFRMDIKGEKTLYANSLIHDSAQKYIFFVNGEPKALPYFDNVQNYTFPNFYNNGFAELGTYRDEEIELTVQTSGKDFGGVEIGLLDNEKLAALEKSFENRRAENVTAEKNKLTLTANADKQSLLFLPVEYSKNWTAKVNGKKADILPVMDGAFMAVELSAGQNNVSFVCLGKDILKCAVISVLGLAALIAAILLKRGNIDITRLKLVENAAFIAFNAAVAAAFAVIYIIPIAASILTSIFR